MAVDGGLRADFRRELRHWHWQSIETGGTGLGVPDSNFCHQAVEGWVEFKRTFGWQVPLSPQQVGWLLRRWRAGGYCLVVVRQVRKDGDVLWIFRGSEAEKLLDGGLRAAEPILMCGQPWRWPEVEHTILDEGRSFKEWYAKRAR